MFTRTAKSGTKITDFGIYGDRHYYNNSYHRGEIDECDLKQRAQMIRWYSSKIGRVQIYCGEEGMNTPEYLALLVAVLNKAESLSFDSLGGDAAYGCFMGSMLHQHICLRELEICGLLSNHIISTVQARLLLEGISSCQSLEKLTLDGNFEEPTEVGRALANALKRNKNLTELWLDLNIGDFSDVFQSATMDTRLENIFIAGSRMEGDKHLSFDVTAEALCTNECTLKTLYFDTGISPTERARSAMSNERIQALHNMSVKAVSFCQSSLIDCSRIMVTASLCRSIVKMEISQCDQVSDLSALDPLLIGENLTVETLDLGWNAIREKDAIEFFRKLPQMTCLRELSLNENPFIDESESWKDVLSDATWKNRSLECISCIISEDDDSDDDTEENGLLDWTLPLSLNRGGRRGLEIEPSAPLPANLWPHVLERAGELYYYGPLDDLEACDDPSLECIRSDVIFWLVKEKMVGSCL